MKKLYTIAALAAATALFLVFQEKLTDASESKTQQIDSITDNSQQQYRYPEFYKGIYLNVAASRNLEALKLYADKAKKAGINTFVLDTQAGRLTDCAVPAENVKYLIKEGIHPVARVVVFPEGLRDYPAPESLINSRIQNALTACEAGFKEIQFDYIRFNDSNRLKHLTLAKRYAYVEKFITDAREKLKKYDVKIAADVFGRIPLNTNDLIGQKMESLDKVVDMICPMAYPSHYTWSKKMQHDPYYTVYKTSKRAVERTRQAEIVTYIQAFKMKLGPNNYHHYIKEQIKAVHDSGAKGYILWNARHAYDTAFDAAKTYYSETAKKNL